MKKYFFILILMFSIQGCEYLGLDPTPSPEPISGEVNVSIIESYSNYNNIGYPSFFLNMVTVKDYSCYNYKIISDVTVSGSEIDVDIKGVTLPGDVCLTAIGPATSSILLGITEGQYKLSINDNQVVSTYTVTITKSYISFDQTKSGNTVINNKLLWRYPENSFVYMCGTITQDSLICRDFLDTLKSKISLTEFTFPDSGAIPYPSASQGHYYDMPAKYFYYQSELEFNKIEGILKEYKEKYLKNNVGYGISLINWVNKKIYSWLL